MDSRFVRTNQGNVDELRKFVEKFGLQKKNNCYSICIKCGKGKVWIYKNNRNTIHVTLFSLSFSSSAEENLRRLCVEFMKELEIIPRMAPKFTPELSDDSQELLFEILRNLYDMTETLTKAC